MVVIVVVIVMFFMVVMIVMIVMIVAIVMMVMTVMIVVIVMILLFFSSFSSDPGATPCGILKLILTLATYACCGKQLAQSSLPLLLIALCKFSAPFLFNLCKPFPCHVEHLQDFFVAFPMLVFIFIDVFKAADQRVQMH